MVDDKRKLAIFLKEVSGWDWAQFLKAEKDDSYTTRESIVFALIRAAAMEDLKAITTALNRLDGKMEVPIKIVTPKVYFLFPNAKEAVTMTIIENDSPIAPHNELVLLKEEDFSEEMPSQSFRDTMQKMAGQERSLPARIIKCQEDWEEYSRDRGYCPEETVKVSSVVAARLLKMAQNRNMKALDEVFDQLDGKLVETIRVVGEDMFIMQFGSVAPAGAFKNEDGVYQIEMPRMSQMWGERLDLTKKNDNQSLIEED